VSPKRPGKIALQQKREHGQALGILALVQRARLPDLCQRLVILSRSQTLPRRPQATFTLFLHRP
jgi:hypothetical protein